MSVMGSVCLVGDSLLGLCVSVRDSVGTLCVCVELRETQNVWLQQGRLSVDRSQPCGPRRRPARAPSPLALRALRGLLKVGRHPTHWPARPCMIPPQTKALEATHTPAIHNSSP